MKEKTKEIADGSRRRDTGRIAGQGMKQDTAATLLFKTNNENFAELFNRALPCEPPLSAEELQDEDIKETAHALQLEIRLLDVCRMTDEEICSYTGELRAVFGFRKYADDKEALGNFINANREYFTDVSEAAVDALAELTHSSELMKIRTQEYATPKGGVDVCRGIQGMIRDGRLEGIREGKREGLREGKAEARKEIAFSLSAMGMPVGKIAEATGVSPALVTEWFSAKGE